MALFCVAKTGTKKGAETIGSFAYHEAYFFSSSSKLNAEDGMDGCPEE